MSTFRRSSTGHCHLSDIHVVADTAKYENRASRFQTPARRFARHNPTTNIAGCPKGLPYLSKPTSSGAPTFPSSLKPSVVP